MNVKFALGLLWDKCSGRDKNDNGNRVRVGWGRAGLAFQLVHEAWHLSTA